MTEINTHVTLWAMPDDATDEEAREWADVFMEIVERNMGGGSPYTLQDILIEVARPVANTAAASKFIARTLVDSLVDDAVARYGEPDEDVAGLVWQFILDAEEVIFDTE